MTTTTYGFTNIFIPLHSTIYSDVIVTLPGQEKEEVIFEVALKHKFTSGLQLVQKQTRTEIQIWRLSKCKQKIFKIFRSIPLSQFNTNITLYGQGIANVDLELVSKKKLFV